MLFIGFKNDCIKYANEKGFELFPNGSMYLKNKQATVYEIFDFSFTTSAIKCYDVLYIERGDIYSDMEYKVVGTFEEFKTILDNLIWNFKELKMQNKINAIKKDFK